ncbi:MAG: hypothetical protein J6Y63_01040 [Bacteroidales bacterium]|nr:hypothetical protein [Bacteroidales bacterium]
MSSKYGNIKTADELEKALLRLQAEQKATARRFRKEANHVAGYLKPVNLVGNLVSTVSLTNVGLGMVRGLRKLLTGSAARKH